jgi:hypothetical protein
VFFAMRLILHKISEGTRPADFALLPNWTKKEAFF